MLRSALVTKFSTLVFLLFFLFLSNGCAANKLTAASSCVSASEHANQTTVPELYEAMDSCINKSDYNKASQHLLLARAYGSFDALRVQDKTAGNAWSNLERVYLNKMSIRKLKVFQRALDGLSTNKKNRQAYCTLLNDIGYPQYYPRYMLDYGIKPVQGKGLAEGLDAEKTWITGYVRTCLGGLPDPLYPNRDTANRKTVLKNTNSIRALGRIKDITWSPDSMKVAAVIGGRKSYQRIRVYDAVTGDVTLKADVGDTRVLRDRVFEPIKYSPDGKYLMTATVKKVGLWKGLYYVVTIRDANTGKFIRDLTIHDKYVESLEKKGTIITRVFAVSPNSQEVSVQFFTRNMERGKNKSYVYTFSLRDGKIKSYFSIDRPLNGLEYSLDGKQLWALGLTIVDDSVSEQDWDAKSGQVYKRSWNYAIYAWNAQSGAQLTKIQHIHAPFLVRTAFNFEANLIASSSRTGTIKNAAFGKKHWRVAKNIDPVRLWDLQGNLLNEFPVKIVASGVTISPDGSLLVTCGPTYSKKGVKPILVWDAVSGNLLQPIRLGLLTSGGGRAICAFSPDGSKLAVGVGSYIEIYDRDKK